MYWLPKSLTILIFLGHVVFADVDPDVQDEKKIADLILKALEHFKQPDPIGVPGVDMPEPLEYAPFSFNGLDCKDVNIWGLGRFRTRSFSTELSQMKAHAVITLESLKVTGNYMYRKFFVTFRGPFTIKMTNINTEAHMKLRVDRAGKLKVDDIEVDFTYDTIDMNFENAGAVGSFLNSFGSWFVGWTKKILIPMAYDQITMEVNTKLDGIVGDLEFANSISPLDMLVADARLKIKQLGFEPLSLKDHTVTQDLYTTEVMDTCIYGLSSFYRVGDIAVYMENNTIFADFEIGTQRLRGETQWRLSFVSGYISTTGTALFTVDYIKARIIVSQVLNMTNAPVLNKFDLEIGNIQARSDGAGTIDYVIEIIVNILPNLLRNQILEVVERPMRRKIQEAFDQIDVEETIVKTVNNLNGTKLDDFTLSSLKNIDIDIPDLDSFLDAASVKT